MTKRDTDHDGLLERVCRLSFQEPCRSGECSAVAFGARRANAPPSTRQPNRCRAPPQHDQETAMFSLLYHHKLVNVRTRGRSRLQAVIARTFLALVGLALAWAASATAHAQLGELKPVSVGYEY